VIKATHEFDWIPTTNAGRVLKTSWGNCGKGKLCLSFQFDVGHYIPPAVWKMWKPPAGWRKSGFYMRANRYPAIDEFRLIFPCVRLYADPARTESVDPSTLIAMLKLIQRPYK
jgi:hypothetical protein